MKKAMNATNEYIRPEMAIAVVQAAAGYAASAGMCEDVEYGGEF